MFIIARFGSSGPTAVRRAPLLAVPCPLLTMYVYSVMHAGRGQVFIEPQTSQECGYRPFPVSFRILSFMAWYPSNQACG